MQQSAPHQSENVKIDVFQENGKNWYEVKGGEGEKEREVHPTFCPKEGATAFLASPSPAEEARKILNCKILKGVKICGGMAHNSLAHSKPNQSSRMLIQRQ